MKPVFLLLLAVLGASSTKYFPEGPQQIDESRQRWYSEQLEALKEPSLYGSRDVKQGQIYRFVWLRTFHHPIALRIEVSANNAKLIIKEADGAGGYKPGKLIRNSEVPLSAGQTLQLLQELQSSDFWKEPTNEIGQGTGFDGARWIFEGVKEGNYHVVDRWSPPIRENKFAKLGRTFIDLANLNLPKDDIY